MKETSGEEIFHGSDHCYTISIFISRIGPPPLLLFPLFSSVCTTHTRESDANVGFEKNYGVIPPDIDVVGLRSLMPPKPTMEPEGPD